VSFPTDRPRRLRRTDTLRRLVRETHLSPANLIEPLFVCSGEGVRRPIAAMPGCFQLSVDELVAECRDLPGLGISGVILFGLPDAKDPDGAAAADPQGPVATALTALRRAYPALSLWADVCLCEYTDHGHCGPLATGPDGRVDVDNDRALPRLADAALAYATAGADVVAPSDMMDGRVARVRAALDARGFNQIPILAYSAKYASGFYGPFREAADSTPQFGDRRSHQMDPANQREAMREIALDIEEGADIIMIKPALPYLDVIALARRQFDVPIAAYQVSGEFSLIEAAARMGWIDRERIILETLTSIQRAGADMILTYFAKDAVRLLGR